jgi:hypothetical protein
MSKHKYTLAVKISHYSHRYNRYVTVPKDYESDGATYAVDIDSLGWWVHDWLKDKKVFDDGTRCSNWQASRVLSDILKAEGFTVRYRTWLYATWIFGELF